MAGVAYPRLEDSCREADNDALVADVGPLAFDVGWYAALRGLPFSKLSAVPLCIKLRLELSEGV